MRKKSRKKKEDVIAGILIFFLVIFLSGRIFSAGWEKFHSEIHHPSVTKEGRSAGLPEPELSVKESAAVPDYVPPQTSVPTNESSDYIGIRYLTCLRKAYSDLSFEQSWDAQHDDWLIRVTVPASQGQEARTADFYWAGGALLPGEELENADSYWSILYDYPRGLADPADMTEEEKEVIREFSSTENRKNGAGTSMFFFDFLYQSDTRGQLESHITSISFLKHRANVHERIVAPLMRVEKRVFALAKTDAEVAGFLAGLKSNDSYLWRTIAGTKRKSFHSLGIALDVLPKSQGGKQIFWSWAKDKYPNDWMLIPLKDRWMPPKSVIEAFEEEGFIWGGKWAIWDNMHFEYHPELIEYNFHR